MGPFLMAGLTNGTRHITADPAKVADLITDLPASATGKATLLRACMHLTYAVRLFVVCLNSLGSPAGYPTGSKCLSGKHEQFVIAPLGSIVEESYTSYFIWEMGGDGNSVDGHAIAMS